MESPRFVHWFQAFLDISHPHLTPHLTVIYSLESQGWFSRADSTSFAILSIKLESMDDHGSPPRLVENHVKMYFSRTYDSQRALHFYDVTFSFSMLTDIREYTRRTVAIVTELKQ
jgi:hypothetical protein